MKCAVNVHFFVVISKVCSVIVLENNRVLEVVFKSSTGRWRW